MEQVKYLEKILYVKYLPDIKVAGNTYKNSDALMLSLAAFTFLNLLGYFYPFSVLLFGIVLPIWCLIQGADLGGYFAVFSVVLWLRLWYHDLSALDVVTLIFRAF